MNSLIKNISKITNLKNNIEIFKLLANTNFVLDKTLYKKEINNYTRSFLEHKKNEFIAMIICWGPNSISPIHDHNCECYYKVLEGKITEKRFIEDSNKLLPISNITLENNSVGHINDNMGVHLMENPTNDFVYTFHLYIPPYDSCNIYPFLNDISKKEKIPYPLP